MSDKIEDILKRYKELETLLSSQEVLSNPGLYRDYAKELASKRELAGKYSRYQDIQKEIGSLKKMLHDDDCEMRKMAEQEIQRLEEEGDRLQIDIKTMLVPQDPDDDKNVIMEIRAGTGGEEAALFAGDLFRMYSRYVEKMNWQKEVLSSNPTDLGGFKEIIFSIIGRKVYKHLKMEKGVHRVQRVPDTEASGRIHTSAVTVAVLPEREEVDIIIDNTDLRIDTYRSSGKGGQHLNVTDSAVRITHVPTGLVVQCQDERSQIKNRAKAMKILRARLWEKIQQDREKQLSSERKSQVGSGDRSEKIRTYNFPQDRLTDHRSSMTLHNLSSILDGNLEELIEGLMEYDFKRREKTIGS